MYKNCTIKINGKSYTFDANGVYITAAAANKKKTAVTGCTEKHKSFRIQQAIAVFLL